jgi:hypothetical protein
VNSIIGTRTSVPTRTPTAGHAASAVALGDCYYFDLRLLLLLLVLQSLLLLQLILLRLLPLLLLLLLLLLPVLSVLRLFSIVHSRCLEVRVPH